MTLSITNLTANITTSADYEVTGDGVFDDLMETVNAHLDAQYKLGRITGTDYSTVYLGALQATIQQAVAYLLGQEKTNSDVALTEAQTAMVRQQEVTEWAKTEQSTKVTPAVGSPMAIETTKTDAERALIDTQKTTMADKTSAEIALLNQKEVTEFAQTNQITKTAADPDSTIGKQQNLFTEQAKGFKWNADQKYLKTLLDAWSINISTAGVAATGVDAINENAANGINQQIARAEPS